VYYARILARRNCIQIVGETLSVHGGPTEVLEITRAGVRALRGD